MGPALVELSGFRAPPLAAARLAPRLRPSAASSFRWRRPRRALNLRGRL